MKRHHCKWVQPHIWLGTSYLKICWKIGTSWKSPWQRSRWSNSLESDTSHSWGLRSWSKEEILSLIEIGSITSRRKAARHDLKITRIFAALFRAIELFKDTLRETWSNQRGWVMSQFLPIGNRSYFTKKVQSLWSHSWRRDFFAARKESREGRQTVFFTLLDRWWDETRLSDLKEHQTFWKHKETKRKSTLPHWWTGVTSEMRSWNQNYRSSKTQSPGGHYGACAASTEQGSSATQMTASKIMDVIARLPRCDGQAVDAVSANTQVKLEDAPQIAQKSKTMSRYMDTSSTTQVAEIMGRHWRWMTFIWSLLSWIVLEKTIRRNFTKTWVGQSTKLVMYVRSSKTKGISVSMCGWFQNVWKEEE